MNGIQLREKKYHTMNDILIFFIIYSFQKCHSYCSFVFSRPNKVALVLFEFIFWIDLDKGFQQSITEQRKNTIKMGNGYK